MTNSGKGDGSNRLEKLKALAARPLSIDVGGRDSSPEPSPLYASVRLASSVPLVGVAAPGFELVFADPELGALLGSPRAVTAGTSLLDVVDAATGERLAYVSARVVSQVVVPPRKGEEKTVVVRAALVGDETWFFLYEERAIGPAPCPEPRLAGRRAELAELKRHVVESDASVVYLRGPLGIGKTALLAELAASCRAIGCPCVMISARETAPTPGAVLEAVRRETPDVQRGATLFDALQRLAHWRWMLLVDDFDAWQDAVARDAPNPLAELPLDCRIVVAARRPLDRRFWERSGRAPRTRVLSPLPPEDAAEVLAREGVPGDRIAEVAAHAGGHPLGIQIVAGALRAGVSPTGAALDLDLDAVAERSVLEAAALPSRITEEVLSAVLDADDDAAAAYDRLHAVCVADPSGVGLRMPPFLRGALRARLRERSPVRYGALQKQLAAHYAAVLETHSAPYAYPVVEDLLDAFDDHPFIAELAGVGWSLPPRPRKAQPRDRDAVAAAALRFFEPRAAARVLRRFDSGAAVTSVIEDGGRILGLLQHVTPTGDELARIDEPQDPELGAAVEAIRRQTTATPDERVLAYLAWATPDPSGADWGPVNQSVVRHVLSLVIEIPRVIAALSVDAAPPAPRSIASFMGLGSLDIGGRHVLYLDLRAIPPRMLLRALVESSEHQPIDAQSTGPNNVTIVTPDSVREALFHLDKPEKLAQSPLVSLKLVTADAGSGADPVERAAALGRLLHRTIASLEGGPRERKEREALHAAFIERSGKHEKIASDLGLPYSTFRRYLARGIERVAERIRLRERAAR